MLLSACAPTALTPEISFNESTVTVNGVNVARKKLYSTIPSSELITQSAKYTDPSSGAVFDWYINNNFFKESALKDGYYGFGQNVYATKDESINSLYRAGTGLFYDGMLFPNVQALNVYAETKKELILESNTTAESVVLKGKDGQNNSQPINLNSLRKGSLDEKVKLLDFITKNSKLQIEIDKPNGQKETVSVDSTSSSETAAAKVIAAAGDKSIPLHYQKVSSNNNTGQFILDSSVEDKYEFYGPLIHQGSADIQAINNPDNWSATSTIPVGLYRDQQTTLVTHSFDFLIGEISVQEDLEIKRLSSSLNKEDYVFFFPYSEAELYQPQKTVNLELNLIWTQFMELLKTEQKTVYDNFLKMINDFSTMKRYTGFYKTIVIYSHLLDALVANQSSEKLIFLLKDFFVKLADKVDTALNFLNSLTTPLGFNILQSRDRNAVNFSFKKYFGFGENDFDLGANLNNLLPNLQYTYRNLNILFTIIFLSNAIAAMPSSFIDKEAIVNTLKGLRMDSDKNIEDIYKPLINNNWKAIEPLWWLINSQNITQALFTLGYDTKTLNLENLTDQQLQQIVLLNQVLGIKWARNQIVLTLANEKIKEELPQAIRDVPTTKPEVRELFAFIPKNVLVKLQSINADLQTLIVLKNMFKALDQAQKTDPNKAEEYKAQIESFLESLQNKDFVDLYLRYSARFKTLKTIENHSVSNIVPTNRSVKKLSITRHAGKDDDALSVNSSISSSSSSSADSDVISTSKIGGVPAILRNSTSDISIKELDALEKNHVENIQDKINGRLQGLFAFTFITDSFQQVMSSAAALAGAINNPNALNRTRDIVISSLQLGASASLIISTAMYEIANWIPKIGKIVSKIGPIIEMLGTAVSLALFLFDVFFPKEEKTYYVFKSNGSEFVWTGGYRKTWLLGLKVLEENTIRDLKLVQPTQITRPQNRDYLYYNKKEYSTSQVEELRKVQVKEWIENTNFYANNNEEFIKGARKVYSLHNQGTQNFSSVYTSQSLSTIYNNLLATLTNNGIIGIDNEKFKTIAGNVSNSTAHSNAIYREEVKKAAQDWTIIEVPKATVNGLMFHKERSIQIQRLESYDETTGIGVATGFGRYGLEGQEATFIIVNKPMTENGVKENVMNKFNELYTPVQTKYLDSVGSRSKLIYETNLYEVYNPKLGKNVYFVSISDASRYIRIHL